MGENSLLQMGAGGGECMLKDKEKLNGYLLRYGKIKVVTEGSKKCEDDQDDHDPSQSHLIRKVTMAFKRWA